MSFFEPSVPDARFARSTDGEDDSGGSVGSSKRMDESQVRASLFVWLEKESGRNGGILTRTLTGACCISESSLPSKHPKWRNLDNAEEYDVHSLLEI